MNSQQTTPTIPNTETTSYKENYLILKQTAEELRRSTQDVDIDELLPKVERAVRASSVCKERLDMAQKALDAIFGDSASEASTP